MIKMSLRFWGNVGQEEIKRRLFPDGDVEIREWRRPFNGSQVVAGRKGSMVKFGESLDSETGQLWETAVEEINRLCKLFPDEWKGVVELVFQVAVYQEDARVELPIPADMLAAISGLGCALDLDVYFC